MTRHYVLTLDGTAQQLSSVLSPPQVQGPADVPCGIVTLQPEGTNANPVYVGADNSVASTSYGLRLEAGATGVPPAPLVLGEGGGPIRLSDLWVKGTNTEKLHILLVS